VALAAEQAAAELGPLVGGDADALIGNRQDDVVVPAFDADQDR
jgi:hypothetical protein